MGMACNDGAEGNEMGGEGNIAGGDCGAQHGCGFGHRVYHHYLLGVQALFTGFIYGLVKWVKERVNMFVQQNRSVYVMSKLSVKESKCSYGE
jgi:hypothetical protein